MKKLNSALLILAFCGLAFTSNAVETPRVQVTEDEDGLVCTVRNAEGHASRCWFCNCEKWAKNLEN
jgi:hypothetical protein